MALDTYDNLKLEIIDWSHRKDVDLKIDTFIALAETEMYNNSVENLKVRGQESLNSQTLSTITRNLTLPSDYLSMRSIRIQVGDIWRPVYFEAPESLNIRDDNGIPCFFTVTSQIEFDIVSESDYPVEIQYLAKPTALSSSNQTNIVLTDNPSIYLFGSLAALYRWADQPEDYTTYYNQFISAIVGANANYDAGRYGPAPTMRVDGSTP